MLEWIQETQILVRVLQKGMCEFCKWEWDEVG